MAFVLSSDGEWLARRTTRDHVDGPENGRPIHLPNIALPDRPVPSMFKTFCLVHLKGSTGVSIPLYQQVMVEAGSGRSQRQSTASAEQFEAAHNSLPLHHKSSGRSGPPSACSIRRSTARRTSQATFTPFFSAKFGHGDLSCISSSQPSLMRTFHSRSTA